MLCCHELRRWQVEPRSVYTAQPSYAAHCAQQTLIEPTRGMVVSSSCATKQSCGTAREQAELLDDREADTANCLLEWVGVSGEAVAEDSVRAKATRRAKWTTGSDCSHRDSKGMQVGPGTEDQPHVASRSL